jgi:capsular polysaccharide biosynthesis protein
MFINSIRKYIIIFVLSLFLAILSLFFVEQKYTASIVISKTTHVLKANSQENQEANLKSSANNLKKLISLIQTRNFTNQDFEKFLYFLTSSDLSECLAKDKKVIEYIPSKMSLSSFILYGSFYEDDVNAIHKFLKKNVSIEPVKETSLTQINVRHKDKDFAKYLINQIYKQSDDLIKEQAKITNQYQIDFIEKALKQKGLEENKQAFANLLSEQLQQQLMLSSSMPYAAELVSMPQTSQFPDSVPLVLVFLGLIILYNILFYLAFEVIHIYILKKQK